MLSNPPAAPPPGAHHRHSLQNRWWMLPNPSTVPSRGATIDVVFNLGGRRCLTHQQCPSGGPPSTSSSKLSGEPCRTHRQCPLGEHHRSLAATGSHWQWTVASIHCQHLLGGTGKLSLLGVPQARRFAKKLFDPCDAKDSKKKNHEEDIIQRDKKQSLFTKQKMTMPQVEVASPMHLQVGAQTAQLRPSQLLGRRPV
jgi:hypothetical protein